MQILSYVLDVLEAIAIIAVFISYYFASKDKKREYFYSRNRELYKDNNLLSCLYLSEQKMIKNGFENDEVLYSKVISSLSYFNSICYANRNKLIKSDEYLYFCVEMDNLVNNEGVQSYLANNYKISIDKFIRCGNKIDDVNKYDFVDEFLPYLSLQVYVYAEAYKKTFKEAARHFNDIGKEYYLANSSNGKQF